MTKNDSVTYESDGSITFVVRKEKYLLNAPTLGQFKVIKKELYNAQSELTAMTGASPTQLLQGSVSVSEEVTDRSIELNIGLLRLIFETVGDKPLPEDADNWPTWLVLDGTLAQKLLVHWRNVPLDSSG